MPTQTHVLAGTRKAAFIYASDSRKEWSLSQPLLAGWEVFHMAADLRHDPPLLYAAANNPWWGPSIARSADGGKTWDQRTTGLGFPKDMGIAIQNVWYVQPGPESEPGVVYAGTQPPGLFRSEDWGASWAAVESLTRHEYRTFFQGIGEAPNTGSPLHSIEIDPRDSRRMYVAISGGGSYMTRDGGKSWELFSHHAVPAEPRREMFVSQGISQVPPDVDPAAVWDMHKFVLDEKAPDRLWTQAHTGVFRSDDAGATWHDVTPPRLDMVVRPAAPTPGLYEFHGFPIAVTRRDPDAAYLLPLQADDFRVCPGQLTVYRTRDGGATWQTLTNGLPGPGDYQSAYREGMDTDGLDPEGIYVGTSNGQIYASIDGGDRWQRLPGTLPPVLSITCAVY